MSIQRTYTTVIERLRDAGLRPTRQRKELGKLLFDGPDRHVTAEALHSEAAASGIRVSLATVYNTLNQFTDAGLLREIVVDGDRAYFDTNVSNHHHFYHVDSGALQDIDGTNVVVSNLPEAPHGATVERIDVVVRVSGARQ
ncbi:MAG: Fur family transcriptional regulator [Rhodospirillales bacterium]